MSKPSVEQLDAILPQTQCGLCEYQGCKPYAEAMINAKEDINRCPPGGVDTLRELAAALNKDPTPFIDEMTAKAKPPTVAHIREEECIGCTKCIAACPVDAIVGTGKMMHTVISDACTGCELCLAPCPVDCIDLIVCEQPEPQLKKQQAAHWRDRFNTRNARLARREKEKMQQYQKNKRTATSLSLEDRKAHIAAAVKRAQAKKQAPHE